MSDSHVAAAPDAHIREATLDEAVAAMRMVYSVGLSGPTSERDIRDSWNRLYVKNPALSMRSPPPPIGWIMEADADSRMVGFFANLPRRYRLGDRRLLVAVGTMWGVEKPFRSQTKLLSDAYFAQPADMFLVTTSIKPTGMIFAKYGGAPLPQLDHDVAMYWVVGSQAFLRVALEKKGLSGVASAAASFALAPGLAITKRKPGRHVAGLEPEAIPLARVGAEFDELWERKNAEDPRLYASRAAADLRWHFEMYEQLGRFRLLACRRNGKLAGYAALVRDETPETGLARTKIADLFVAGNDAAVIDALLASAYETAAEWRTAMLEAIGAPGGVREQFERYGPLTQRFRNPPGHFKTDSAELRAALARDDAWYQFPYDGDGAIGWQGPY